MGKLSSRTLLLFVLFQVASPLASANANNGVGKACSRPNPPWWCKANTAATQPPSSTSGTVTSSSQTPVQVQQGTTVQPQNVIVEPLPTQSFTGQSPAPQPQQLPPQVITGYGKVPPQATPTLPQPIRPGRQPGTQKYPTPTPQPYVTPPTPQPPAAVALQAPSFTGVSPVPQPQQLPPQVITGYGKVPPQATPTLPQPIRPGRQSGTQKYPTPTPQPYVTPPTPQPPAAVALQAPSFTGVSPVPQPQQLPPQVITGYGKVPPQATPTLPQPIRPGRQPGTQKYPTPTPQPYVTPPVPQPPAAVALQAPSFTGQSPAPQPQQLPPQVITGYGKVPPQATPTLPQPIRPGRQPGTQKYPTPTPQPYVTPPVPQPKTVTGFFGPGYTGYAPVIVTSSKHSHKGSEQKVVVHTSGPGSSSHTKFDHVPTMAGRVMTEGHRSQFIDGEGKVWTCALSGMGQRHIKDQNGIGYISGHAESLRFRSATTAHLPSNHRNEAQCVVTINKQY